MRYVLSEELLEFLQRGLKSRLGKKHGIAVYKLYVRRLQTIRDIEDDRGLRDHKGLHYEVLDRSNYEHSIRLDQQWRLILWFNEDAEGRYMVIDHIEDYH